jgi:hypothetical protein
MHKITNHLRRRRARVGGGRVRGRIILAMRVLNKRHRQGRRSSNLSPKRSFCSALAGQYKDAGTTGVSALTHPKLLPYAATNHSSAMHVPVGTTTSLLKLFAQQHASDILSFCAVSNTTGAASSVLPGSEVRECLRRSHFFRLLWSR